MIDIMNNIKCVIINWDGVCVSSVQARHLAYQEVFLRLGQANRSWTEQDTQSQSGKNPDKIWADTSLWGNNGPQAKKIFYETYTALLPSEIQLNNNMHAFFTLFKVREPNIPLIAFGAKTQSVMEAEIKKLVAPTVFNGIYGSQPGSPTNKDLSSALALKNSERPSN